MWFSKQLNVTDFESCSVNNAHMYQQLKDHISSCFFLLVWCLPELAGWAGLCSPRVTQCLPACPAPPPPLSAGCGCWQLAQKSGMGRWSLPCWPFPVPVCTWHCSDTEGVLLGSLTLPWQKWPAGQENWILEVMSCPTGQEWPESTIHYNRKILKTSYQNRQQNIASVKCFHSEIKLASFTGLRKILINSLFTMG